MPPAVVALCAPLAPAVVALCAPCLWGGALCALVSVGCGLGRTFPGKRGSCVRGVSHFPGKVLGVREEGGWCRGDLGAGYGVFTQRRGVEQFGSSLGS